MLYPVKVNMALAGMGISPTMIEGALRSRMQQACKSCGLSPQEAALTMAAHQFGPGWPDGADLVITAWKYEGKIAPSKPEVEEALSRMGIAIA